MAANIPTKMIYVDKPFVTISWKISDNEGKTLFIMDYTHEEG